MTTISPGAATRDAPSFAELYTPKLFTILREGYGLKELKADAFAGATVAIVALPLSMAIAIASGVGPERGLYAAIFGGFLVSALGGSRFQIGGPAGAFIVLVAACVEKNGVDGMLLATFLAGLIMTASGFLKLGTYIRLIPYPVTVGFTAGIALIIFSSQIKDLLGLTISGATDAGFIGTLTAAGAALPTVNIYAAGLSIGTIALIVLIRRWRPSLPSILIAVTAAGVVATVFHFPVETIGTRFGGVPSGVPAPHPPPFSLAKIMTVMPDAFAFALLGSIESLLSATVADAMTGRRHRSNCELVAQGAANMLAAIFGAMVVTGTIARTATNVRAGAHGPISGILHSAILLLFMIVAAPLASYAPLAALAGVLAVVAWNMIEREAMASLVRTSKGDAIALAATFLLTVFRDLTDGIIVGVAIGAISFINRMAQSATLKTPGPLVIADQADGAPAAREAYQPENLPEGVALYRITGALFFGSAASLAIALDKILAGQKKLVLDFSGATFVDSTGAQAIKSFTDKAVRQGVSVVISGASIEARRALAAGGVSPAKIRYEPTLAAALAAAGPA